MSTLNHSLAQCRLTARQGPVFGRALVRCRGMSSRQHICELAEPQQQISKRDLLLLANGSLLAASWMAAGPAAAVCADLDTEEAGDACRQAELAKDSTGDYRKLSSVPKKSLAPNVPVGNLDTEYAKATKELAQKINTYITSDVYDKSRQPLIKSLKIDGSSWVSKYARGGSARSQSARNMYIAVDAVQGYLASNGLAPMPSSKARVVTETVSTALEYLAEGR